MEASCENNRTQIEALLLVECAHVCFQLRLGMVPLGYFTYLDHNERLRRPRLEVKKSSLLADEH